MSDPMWINGTCDRIMSTLEYWIRNYDKGTISAEGEYLTKPGQDGPAPHLITVPTRRACKIAWKQDDLDYFIKILEAKLPKNDPTYALARDMRANFPKWRYGIICPGGARMIVLDWYLDHIAQIYRLLGDMKSGKTKEAREDLSSFDLSKVFEKSPGVGS